MTQPNSEARDTEPDIQLFEAQKKVYPRDVVGRYRRLKWFLMAICLGLYYFAPFLRWDRGPKVPDQAILIDLPNRRAYFFMIEIWPQEVYYIAGILIFAAVTLFFVTSLLGRVWCGYFCFQTVWTDIYYKIERIVQGDRNARIKLDESPLSFEKIWKKLLTHILWIVVAVLTAGAFVFYFNDAPTLWKDIFEGNVSTTVFGFVVGLTASTYIMAGFAREQVCTYMCPYARFQSAMFDKDTLIIGYEPYRGEPRGKHKAGTSWEGKGHCVDCSQCVQVCPTGIDIRNGLQLECIACGLCVDACNSVMDKLELPRGLIRYDTEHNFELRLRGHDPEIHMLRPRTVAYSLILAVVGLTMLVSLLLRSPLELHAIHDRNPLFVVLSDGKVRNGYELKVLNKTHEDNSFRLSVEGLEGAQIHVQSVEGSTPENLKVKPDSVGHFRVFISAPKQSNENKEIVFRVKDNAAEYEDDVESLFISGEGK